LGILTWLTAAVAGSAAQELPPPPWDLATCLRIAQERNPELAAARAAWEAARGQYHQVLGGYLPTVSASLNFSQNTVDFGRPFVDPVSGRIVFQRDVDDFYYISASVRQPIIDFPTAFRIRAGRHRFSAARMQEEDTRQRVAYQVADRYYGLLSAIKLLEVAEEAARLSKEQFRRTESLFRLGSAPRADVLQSRVTLSQSELELVSARNDLRKAEADLARALGLPPSTPVRIDTAGVEAVGDTTWAEEDLIQLAWRHRPDLAQARLEVAAALEDLRAQKWRRWPSLDLTAYYSKQADAISLDWLDEATSNARWGFAVSLTMNLNPVDQFWLGATKGAIESAAWTYRQARRQLRQKELQVALEVRQAFLAWEEARERLRMAEENVRYAQENLKLQQALYETGGADLLEWTQARVDLTRARSQAVQARMDLLRARVQLERSVGTTLP
jgi:outer membrane protein